MFKKFSTIAATATMAAVIGGGILIPATASAAPGADKAHQTQHDCQHRGDHGNGNRPCWPFND